MHTRKAKPADVEALFTLAIQLLDTEDTFAQAIDEELMGFRTRREDIEVSGREATRKGIENEDTGVYVAEEEGDLIGLALMALEDRSAAAPWFTEVRVGKLRALVVHADHRGKGVASALHERFLEWCQENDCGFAKLDVFDNNPAKGIYDHWGYTTTLNTMYRKL